MRNLISVQPSRYGHPAGDQVSFHRNTFGTMDSLLIQIPTAALCRREQLAGLFSMAFEREFGLAVTAAPPSQRHPLRRFRGPAPRPTFEAPAPAALFLQT